MLSTATRDHGQFLSSSSLHTPNTESTMLVLGSNSKYAVSLESIGQLMVELQEEKQWHQIESRKLFQERNKCSEDLREVNRELYNLQQKKLALENHIGKLTHQESIEKQKIELLEEKIASIGKESARFEQSIRQIKETVCAGGLEQDLINAASKNNGDGSSSSVTDFSPIMTSKPLFGHKQSVYTVRMDDSLSTAASGSSDQTIKLWDLVTGKCMKTLRTGSTTYDLQFKGRCLVSGSSDHQVYIWDTSACRLLRTLKGHKGAVHCLQMSVDQSTSYPLSIVSGSSDQTVRVWDTDSGYCTKTLSGHKGSINAIQYWDYALSSASSDGTIKMWDLRSGKCHRTLDSAHKGAAVTALQFDNCQLVSGGSDSLLNVWDLRNGSVFRSINTHHPVHTLQFNAHTLVAATTDNLLKSYDVKYWTPSQSYAGHSESVLSLDMIDQAFITASSDCTIRLWNL